jgi:hypothetical protein
MADIRVVVVDDVAVVRELEFLCLVNLALR